MIWFLDGTGSFTIGLIVGREMMPLKISRPLFLDPVNAISCGKMDFAVVIQLRIFRWGDYSGLILWPQTQSRVLIRGRQREFCTQRGTQCDRSRDLALEMKEGLTRQEMLQMLEKARKQPLLWSLRRAQPAHTLAFTQ